MPALPTKNDAHLALTNAWWKLPRRKRNRIMQCSTPPALPYYTTWRSPYSYRGVDRFVNAVRYEHCAGMQYHQLCIEHEKFTGWSPPENSYTNRS